MRQSGRNLGQKSISVNGLATLGSSKGPLRPRTEESLARPEPKKIQVLVAFDRGETHALAGPFDPIGLSDAKMKHQTVEKDSFYEMTAVRRDVQPPQRRGTMSTTATSTMAVSPNPKRG